ncbi:hypothetical protein OIU78_009788 [Salix suchowensis]|nr:hypothetical protein OIU78_009788 [Salix suchowensis]
MELIVLELSQIQQSSSSVMRKHPREYYGFIGSKLEMMMLSLLLFYVLELGACAGIIAMSATYPMDMVRGRLTVQTDKSPCHYRGITHALSTVLKEEGPRALYKGWLPSVIGVIPYVGLNFSVYESLKDWLLKTNPFGLVEDNELGVTTRLACGAAAGTVGQTIAYPLDVIRRRMQMVGWKDAASVVTGDGRSKAPLEYSGMVDTFRKNRSS